MSEPTRRHQSETFEHTIFGLLTKRADTLGEVMRLRDRLIEMESDIAALDRVLGTLGYTGDLEAVPPRRAINASFGRGQIMRAVLDVMREAGTAMTARQIAEAVFAKLEQGSGNAVPLEALVHRVSQALQRLKRERFTASVSDGRGGLAWKLQG